MGYGIPYKGSKNGIADKIINIIPSADNFYDLFGGGGAISHCAFLSGKFKNVIYNEPDKLVSDLFKRAVAGEFNSKKFKPKWVSREEFFLKKDTDGYIGIIWSFGNKRSSYLFGKDLEGQKEALHNAVVFENYSKLALSLLGNKKLIGRTVNARRLYCRSVIVKRLRDNIRLEQLERLQQLQQLQQLERLQQYSKSYDKIQIKENSVIYCDPPYRDTSGYELQFNNDKFEEWAASHKYPVFISEYSIKNKRLYPVYKTGKGVTIGGGVGAIKNENLFANYAAVKLLAKDPRLSILVQHLKLRGMK